MKEIWSFAVAFARFWYRFIIGDDWTLAAAVAVGLVLTWVLIERGLTAWWLVPVVVVVAVTVSILRAPLATAAAKGDAGPRATEPRKTEDAPRTTSAEPVQAR